MRTTANLRHTRIDSVKELLARRVPTLTRLTDQAARQDFWRDWLAAHLPQPLRDKLSGITERDGTLVVFAQSAAWCARLRYVLLELETEIREAAPQVSNIEVRVLPRARS